MVKKDGVSLVKKPHQLKMFPQFYLLHLQQQLKTTEYLTLKKLVYLLQCHRQVSIELLASLMPSGVDRAKSFACNSSGALVAP
jgi:hypothetical protein